MYICDETTSLELLNHYLKMSIVENVNVSITHVTNLNLRGGNEKSNDDLSNSIRSEMYGIK